MSERIKLSATDSLIMKQLTVVVLCPPVKMASVDDIVKGDWEMEVSEETYPELLVQYALEQWCKDADKEEKDP